MPGSIKAANAVGGDIDLKLIDNGDGTYSLQHVAAPLSASGVTAATSSGLSSASTWAPTFAYVPGRQFYLTLGGTGTGTVTVTYSRDNGSSYVPEVTAVDGGAPITLNSVNYAGSAITLPLSQSEAGLKIGIKTGTLVGTITARLSV